MLDLLTQFDVGLISDTFQANAWSIDNLLDNVGEELQGWLAGIGMILGVLTVIYGLYCGFKIATDKQGRPMNTFNLLLAFLIGGFLIGASWGTVKTMATGIGGTVENLGK